MNTTPVRFVAVPFVQQKRFETALTANVRSPAELADAVVHAPPERQLQIVPFEEAQRKARMLWRSS